VDLAFLVVLGVYLMDPALVVVDLAFLVGLVVQETLVPASLVDLHAYLLAPALVVVDLASLAVLDVQETLVLLFLVVQQSLRVMFLVDAAVLPSLEVQ
tara:strand:- start:6 stop:299 length:294 start_codon:yes stop_codon:yes gene_type:complete